jgi:soluble lytic murein transglycosylase
MRPGKGMILLMLAFALIVSSCTRSMAESAVIQGNTNQIEPTVNLTFTPTTIPTPEPSPTPVPVSRISSADQALFFGDWDRAIKEYQAAFDASNDPQILATSLLGIGRAYLDDGNSYQADAYLNQLISTYPDTIEAIHAYVFLGQNYQNQKNYAQAAEAYKSYIDLSSGVIDAYIWDLHGDMLFAAGDYLGSVESYQAALGTSTSSDSSYNPESDSVLDEIFLNMKLARSYALGGDHTTALALYDDLYSRTNNHYTRALIDLRKGQIHTELGQTEQAHEAYFDAVYNYPTSNDSYLALVELVDAQAEVHELNRGIVDYYAGQYGLATEAFNRYLNDNPSDPASAYYFYGLSTRALGGHEEAVTWWDKIINDYGEHRFWDQAWEQKAYTQWAFIGDYDAAIATLLGFVDQVSAHTRAAEFLFDAALVSERAGYLEQAIELWKRVANVYPDDERASRSIFLAGITYFRLGEYSQALNTFQRYLTLAPVLGDRAAGHFWIGKTQEALGNTDEARINWETAAATDPTGYYSERARDVINGPAVFTPPEQYDLMSDPENERIRAEAWMRETFQLPEDVSLSSLGELAYNRNLQRGKALWDLGLYDHARLEFEQLRQSVESDPVKTYQLANYLIDIGAYRSGIFAARQVLNLASMDDAATLSAPILFNHQRFGTYYKDLLMSLADEYAFHPLFLFSLVRQESLFDPTASSAVDARGLMQIMPLTGDEIQRNLGWPEDYTTEDLNRPIINLRFGIDYLNTQRSLFDGNMYAALAAYNAGPGNSQTWLQLAPDDPDLFLELIRYKETRDYIRRIYEFFTIYRYLYNRTP